MDSEHARDAITTLLREPQLIHPEEIAALAETYSAACRAANARLRRCAEYLQRGMRSEAVHLAACPPDVVRLVASLRLDDPAGWEALCLTYGHPRPPRPRVDLAERLPTAVADDRKLAPLLERLRVMTLSRAPIVDRIAVLRSLRAADPQNPVWDEGLRALEGPRMLQLRSEIDSAASAGDEEALASVVAGLESPGWISPPDEHVVRAARARLDELSRARAFAELPVDELLAAYEQRDYERCTALLDRWQEVGERYSLTLPDELQQQVRPVVTWVAGEARRRILAQRRDLANTVARSDATPPQPGRRWWWPFQ